MEMILAEPAGFMQGVIGDRLKPVHQPSSVMVPKPKALDRSMMSPKGTAKLEASNRADAGAARGRSSSLALSRWLDAIRRLGQDAVEAREKREGSVKW